MHLQPRGSLRGRRELLPRWPLRPMLFPLYGGTRTHKSRPVGRRATGVVDSRTDQVIDPPLSPITSSTDWPRMIRTGETARPSVSSPTTSCPWPTIYSTTPNSAMSATRQISGHLSRFILAEARGNEISVQLIDIGLNENGELESDDVVPRNSYPDPVETEVLQVCFPEVSEKAASSCQWPSLFRWSRWFRMTTSLRKRTFQISFNRSVSLLRTSKPTVRGRTKHEGQLQLGAG